MDKHEQVTYAQEHFKNIAFCALSNARNFKLTDYEDQQVKANIDYCLDHCLLDCNENSVVHLFTMEELDAIEKEMQLVANNTCRNITDDTRELFALVDKYTAEFTARLDKCGK